MVVSVFLKIKFRHTQISVPKIGITMSKIACINPCMSSSMFHWTLSALSTGSSPELRSAALTPFLLWSSWRDFKTTVLLLINLPSLNPLPLQIFVTALMRIIADWASGVDFNRSSTRKFLLSVLAASRPNWTSLSIALLLSAWLQQLVDDAPPNTWTHIWWSVGWLLGYCLPTTRIIACFIDI